MLPQSLDENLRSYKRLREVLLTEGIVSLFAKLGPGAFRAITGEVCQCSPRVIRSFDSYVNRSMGYAI